MHDSPEDDVKWAVLTLIDNADHLPAPLAAELRKCGTAPDGGAADGTAADGRAADLVRQRYACSVLLGYTDSLPAPLEIDLGGYARQLDYAMSTRMVEPDMTDADFLDAVAGILRSPHRSRRILDDIRAIVHRSGRGAASYQGQAPGTVTHISEAIEQRPER